METSLTYCDDNLDTMSIRTDFSQEEVTDIVDISLLDHIEKFKVELGNECGESEVELCPCETRNTSSAVSYNLVVGRAALLDTMTHSWSFPECHEVAIQIVVHSFGSIFGRY